MPSSSFATCSLPSHAPLPTRPGGAYGFMTKHAAAISHLLTSYATAHVKEKQELEKKRRQGDVEGGISMTLLAMIVRLQAGFRGYKLRRDMDQEYAAIQIQAAFRGFRERARLDAMIDAMEAELEREMVTHASGFTMFWHTRTYLPGPLGIDFDPN